MTDDAERRETERKARVATMKRRLAEPVDGLVVRDGVMMAASTPPWWDEDGEFRQQTLFGVSDGR